MHANSYQVYSFMRAKRDHFNANSYWIPDIVETCIFYSNFPNRNILITRRHYSKKKYLVCTATNEQIVVAHNVDWLVNQQFYACVHLIFELMLLVWENFLHLRHSVVSLVDHKIYAFVLIQSLNSYF